jgi:hypothetical protein
MLRAVARHRACGLLDQFSGHRVLESEMGFQSRSRKAASSGVPAASAGALAESPAILDAAAAAEPVINPAAQPAVLVQLPARSEVNDSAGAAEGRTGAAAAGENSISRV